MREAGSTAVHTGFWTDHDRGRIRGATLTLSNPRAAALLAFLAILVTFAANRSWKICRFVAHRLMHPRQVETGRIIWTNRQQQVILRNSATAGGALIGMLGISFANGFSGSMVGRAAWKSWLLKLFTVGHWLVFILLSILTSRIIIGRTVVSKVTDTCGLWRVKNMLEETTIDEQDSWVLAYQELLYNTTMDSENYVRNCYDEDTGRGFFACDKFVARSLPFFTEHDLRCPFEEAACLKSAAFAMESGNISFGDLGINSKVSKGLTVRRRTTCSVLNEEIFRAGLLGPKELPQTLEGNERIHYYSVGRDETGQNMSYSYRNDNFSSAYDLRTQVWLSRREGEMGIVEPLDPKGTSNDVSVLFLRGPGVFFKSMHDDPWFAVHKKIVYRNDSGVDPSVEYYQMDRFVNIIGCDERVQFCSHRTGRCTPWNGLLTALLDSASFLIQLAGPDYNETHQARERATEMYKTAVLIGHVLQHTAIPSSIQDRGHGALQATRFFAYGEQFRLDPEQWKLELSYWFQTALARLQIEIFNTIEKPPTLDDERAQNAWDQDDIKLFCGNIKFRSPSHTSLSAAGILVVLLCSFTLTVASFIDLLLALSWLRGIFPIIVFGWKENENLELLNKAVNRVSCYQT